MSNNRKSKLYRIGEVSKITGIPAPVLRSWEKEFPMLKPIKRSGYRYYSEKDLELIFRIKELVVDKGYTVEGARKKLEEKVPSEIRGFLRILDGIKRELEEIKKRLDEDY